MDSFRLTKMINQREAVMMNISSFFHLKETKSDISEKNESKFVQKLLLAIKKRMNMNGCQKVALCHKNQ